MRFLPLLALLGLLSPAVRAEDAKDENANQNVKEDVVKAVRAALGAKTSREREEQLHQVLERPDVDWPSLKAGLMKGPYYQKPLVTAYGQKFSLKDFGVQKRGPDKKMRGFGMWVPKGYDASEPRPLLVYLHHEAAHGDIRSGSDKSGTALRKFKEVCDEYNIFFVAPYTSKGAEWWTPGGRDLVAWAIQQVKVRYSIDENRIGLAGTLDGGDAVWALGQELPGTFSVLMPLTGDPYEIGAMIRPLFLGTLDRMDILMGVPGLTRSTVGEKSIERYMGGLKPLYDQGLRITAALWPRARGDVRYLEQVMDQMCGFLLDRERKPLGDEVDVETERGRPLRSLWLANDGFDEEGEKGRDRFKSTLLKWSAPKQEEPKKRMGFNPQKRPGWDYGLVVANPSLGMQTAKILQGDIVLEVNNRKMTDTKDLQELLKDVEWESEVHVLLAREVRESELEAAQRQQRSYEQIRRKVAELKAQGKPVPANLDSLIEEEDEGSEDDEEDDEAAVIEIGDGDGPKPGAGGVAAGGKREKRQFFLFERWVKIRRPGGALIRHDFGATIDHGHRLEGVKIRSVYAGSLAARSGLKDGDVIVAIGDTKVKNIHDITRFLKEVEFKFEASKKGDHFFDLTVRRINEQGQWGEERGVTVFYEPVQSSRVDGTWDKKENALRMLVHKAKGFTIYFTDELLEPNKEFKLFINDVPYQDLVDPATAPEYPQAHGDPAIKDRVYRMQLKRAKVEGWKPDLRLAADDFLANWDRELIVGAKRSFDLTAIRKGFAQAREREKGRRGKRWERLKRAYEEYRSKGG